jgi:hypothetical protein
MPEPKALERAHRDAEQGKAPSTQEGEFVCEEIEHIRRGRHGARSTKQAIAIGLSKARRAGVKLPPPNSPARPPQRAAKRNRMQPRRANAQNQRADAHARPWQP